MLSRVDTSACSLCCILCLQSMLHAFKSGHCSLQSMLHIMLAVYATCFQEWTLQLAVCACQGMHKLGCFEALTAVQMRLQGSSAVNARHQGCITEVSKVAQRSVTANVATRIQCS
ncbi:hypothetical protein DUNSADRAFT_2076 [Dunaliella salina]|uniref:Secreted protein n=1 Tax=Dunaliella salina TaxID=3046 RepID=A0ABQ7FWN5_DUNSA|nr:hypothetical protein DUNSADRAFT_2076 [Dunaliella salina]|eukprot:KAF5826769.1 hypothetical protein DUNSADRAFT_2076 [Dunaliella salina]